MEFSSLQLYINDSFARQEDFKCFENEFIYFYDKNETYHTIRTQLKNQYFWLYSKYGKPSPHSEEVLNINDFSLDENPRKKNQVEQTSQLFIIFDFDKDILYISNIQQKTFIESIFTDKMENDIMIKNIFKNIDEFYNSIKQIDKITFSSLKRNLFSKDGFLQDNLKDNYCMEEPEEFTIEAVYKQNLSSKLRNTIAKIREEKQRNNIKKIIIQGLDDQGFTKIFNEGNFIDKIFIDLKPDETGMFNEKDVQSLIINKLGLNDV